MRLTVLSLLVLSPLIFDINLENFATLPKAVLIQVLVPALTLSGLILLYKGQRFRLYLDSFHIVFILFLLWGAVSLLWAPYWYDGVELLVHWSACALFYLILASMVLNRKWINIYIYGLIFTALCFSIIGCLQYLFDFQLLLNPHRYPSTFGNPNFAVHVLAMIIPVAAAGLFLSKEIESTIFSGFSLAVMLTYLFYTASQAGIVSMITIGIIIVLLVLFERKKQDTMIRFTRDKWIILTGAVLLFVCLAALPPARKNINDKKARQMAAVSEIYKDPVHAGSGRLKFWPNALMIVKAHPLRGVGLDNFKAFYPRFCYAFTPLCHGPGTDLKRAHNEYIQVAVELGFPGFILFVAGMGLAFRAAIRLLGRHFDPEIRVIGIGIIGGLAGLSVESFFTFPLRMQLPPLLIGFYLAVITFFLSKNSDNVKEISVKKPVAVVLMVFAAILLAASGIHNTNRIGSDRHYFNALAFTGIKQWNSAVVEAKKAYEKNPYQTDNAMTLGRGYIETQQPEKAIKILENVLRMYPYHLNTLLNLSTAYMQNGDLENASKYAHMAKDINPYSAAVDVQLGNVYILKNDFKSAYEHFSAAKQKHSKNVLVYYNLGIIEKERGQVASALANYKKALEINPNMHRIHADIALLYIKQTPKSEKAIPHIKKYLDYDHSSNLARFFIKWLKNNGF
jgi:tetratricopeptide (TPR) repeat protein